LFRQYIIYREPITRSS
jgi:hypothetical protein